MTIELKKLIRVMISGDQEAVKTFRAWMDEKNVFWTNLTMCTPTYLDAHFDEADAFEIEYFFDTLKMQRDKDKSNG